MNEAVRYRGRELTALDDRPELIKVMDLILHENSELRAERDELQRRLAARQLDARA